MPQPFMGDGPKVTLGDVQASPFAADPAFDNSAAAVVTSFESEDEVRSGVVPANAYRVDRSTPDASAVPQPGSGDAAFAHDVELVLEQLKTGAIGKGQLDLSRWYRRRNELSPKAREYLLGLLDELTGTVVYSREHLITEKFVAGPNMTLQQVADRCEVPAALLAKINGVDPAAPLQQGQELKVVLGPYHLEVDLSNREIVAYLVDGRYAGRFPIGVGEEVPVADGKYAISGKIEHPNYQLPSGENVGGGDPRNPLGNLLIEVGEQFGIHGTNSDANIGQVVPPGCIHLRNQDISDLYDMVLTSKSRVTVRR
jgi:lipoprotein-anchoring transpeptidase ErfK/SrfK